MFKVINEIEKDNYTKFVLEPLAAGFGHTIGNSLRRVMLTSLEGGAITSVKINGVSHQFSTVTGISEDVIEILLNLKRVRVKVFSDKPIKLSVKASGKKTVTAGDFEVVGDGEIANPTQVIATLNATDAKLNMEMIAEKGTGYSSVENRKIGELGMIALDAIFSPVVDVNYSVEPTRVGRTSDFDKLILEVTTDGTITPLQALNQGSKLLSQAFKQIYEPEETVDEVVEASSAVSDEVLKMSVEEIDLPVRITNALKAIDINSIEQLVNVPRLQLMKAKNLGAKSLSLISEKLAERGLGLSEA